MSPAAGSRPALVALTALALAAAAALGAVGGCAHDHGRWNVLLVTLDTTRADHLGCYGYPEPTTPAIDALAAEGTLFTRAYTTNPITLPAHTSIMTGTYPVFHGVRDNSTYAVREDLNTLAETLGAAGWDTAAVVGAFVLDRRFNLDQGFAAYDDRISENWSRDELAKRATDPFGFAERKANLVTYGALQWLAGRKSDKPFFLWLHYFDPHQPVDPPEPHHSRFTEPYDGEIAFADEQLGKVLDELRRRGEYDRTLIVVTADHGEGLLDHGEPTHSLFVFDTTMHVPLILRAPGISGGRRDDHLASTVDVLPTILDLVGVAPPAEVQGRSLAPFVRGDAGAGRDWADRTVYMESMVASLEFGWGGLRCLRTATEKLIHGPQPRLYRIAEDPGEVYDRAAEDPARVAGLTTELAQALRRWAAPEGTAERSAPDRETSERLASLGYLTASLGPPVGDRPESLAEVAGLTDPHRMGRVFYLFGIASENLSGGQPALAIDQLQEVLAADPDNPMALTYLGKAYLIASQRPDLAQPLFERALAVNPYQQEARYFLARLLVAQGDLDGARRHLDAILAAQPASVPALVELAQIVGFEGDVGAARGYLERALAVAPTDVGVLVALGSSYARQKQHAEAGEYFRRALDLEPGNPQVLYNVGIWYLQEGDAERAIARLSRVVQIDPADPDANFVLGRLYAERGEGGRARPLLMAARQLSPAPARRAEIDRLLAGLGG